MVKLRAKNLLALALSILMLTGTVTDWLPTALAAEEPGAVTQQDAQPESGADPSGTEGGTTPSATTGVPARQLDFQDPENGRPNLYVDFLGDNIGNGTDPGKKYGQLVAPAAYNKDKRTNKISENSWGGYSSADVTTAGSGNIIFWVGVGVDRTQVWELLRESGNKGITSLELAFYYNDTYIEPYEGKDGFFATIEEANIESATSDNHYPNRWSGNYRLLHAEKDLPVEDDNILRADPITQDTMENPSLNNIRTGHYSDNDPVTDPEDAAQWRMTYVSLEVKNEELTRRLAGVYGEGYQKDEKGEVIIPPAASGTDTDTPANVPDYLMMIPFVVKRYDSHTVENHPRLCLRLVRDASHFSISAGNDGIGDEAEGSYAAWERVTTRNEGKDLKLQLRFAGDLNIWASTEGRVADLFYEATLLIQNGGGSMNTARLSVQNDTGGTPVFVDKNDQTISNLQGGTGMQLDVTVQSGYEVTVWVYYDGTDPGADNKRVQIGWPFATVKDEDREKKYTFVMPDKDTRVLVVFQPGNTRDYNVYLSEIAKPGDADYMLGNEAVVSSWRDYSEFGSGAAPDLRPVSIGSFDPRERHPDDGHGDGPRMVVSKGQLVTLTISTHPDYEARVSLYSYVSGKNIERLEEPIPDDMTWDAKDSTIRILPFGGTLIFIMPTSDVDVVVEYVKVTPSTAKLEVWHNETNGTVPQEIKDRNIAQLAYLSYDGQTAVTTAYSGQVYELMNKDDPENLAARDHSKVRTPSYKTAWVPDSSAAVSNSLGGDTGRKGRVWSDPHEEGATSIMAYMASAPNESNLATRFNGLDLMGADLLGDGTYMGLRKNLDGELYGDDEKAQFAALLWELRAKILADTSAGGLKETYYVEGPLDNGGKYYYFDLTPAQVQAYRIACLEVDGVYRANRQAYREAYQRYQEAKLIYDVVHGNKVTEDATPPILPEEPMPTQVTAASGLREYQGTEYLTEYLASYSDYMDDYMDYIDTLRQAVTTPSVIEFEPTPEDRPGYISVPLLSATAAKEAVKTAISDYKWDVKTVADPTAAISTRSGRTVWLMLEADSAYELESVELWDEAGNNLLKNSAGEILEAQASTSFKNVYTFAMPEKNCTVRVFYKPRDQRTLVWQVKGADGKAENVARIEAYQVTTMTSKPYPPPDPDWPNVYPTDVHVDPTDLTSDIVTPGRTRPTLAIRTNQGQEDKKAYPSDSTKEDDNFVVDGLLVKSLVTVRVSCHEDYDVDVVARRSSDGSIIPKTGNPLTGTYTFAVPALKDSDDTTSVVLTITYERTDTTDSYAHIRILNYDGSPATNANNGEWPNGSRDTPARSGEFLEGKISLAEGYYIHTSYAVGEHGTYPYTLEGNGYNNGTGTNSALSGTRGEIKLTTTMPHEELYIYIIVRKGLPPAEPANALTVVVVDDENTASPLADNWAKATVYARENGAERVALPTAGKGASGAGTTVVHDYTKAGAIAPIMTGDRVELELSAARSMGYYVDSVSLDPSYLGGDLEWLGGDSITSGNRKFQFTMPAGSTTVTVHFRKLAKNDDPPPSYYIHAQKIETDRNGVLVETSNNKITKATSQTIRGYAANGYPLGNKTNPERVPGETSGSGGRGAGVAGEKVTMTFQVDKGWYVQSVAVMTDGSARPVGFTATSGDNDGGGGEFTADLIMPSGDAWFIVKYRQCPLNPDNSQEILPRPEIPEYALTLMVIDNDNVVEPRVSNVVTADFLGEEGMTHDSIHVSVQNEVTATTATDIQYIHAGDRVKLSHDLASGYSMEYMIVNPTELGIVPTYLDAKTAQFTMPARNITVIAKIVKKAPQRYTADLILRPPAGMTVADMKEVGRGTFTNTVTLTDASNNETQFTPSLTDYDKNAIYSLLLTPGEQVDFDLYSFDGYFIREVKIEPAVGATSSLTGSFGYQSGGFVMPAANVYVNVYFEKKWPQEGDKEVDDGAKYDLTLKVHDASAKENNYAYFDTYGGQEFSTADRVNVHGGETYSVLQTVRDGDEIRVALSREPGFYYDPSTIRITDSSGAEISWRLAAWHKDETSPPITGIVFLMPPRATTVEINFHRDNRTLEQNPLREVVLHVDGAKGNETVSLYTDTGAAIWSNGQFIGGLRAGDMLHLRLAIPDASKATRWVAAAYAVDEATGEQLLLPVTQVPDGGLSSFPVPTLPAGADASKAIHVYVSLRDKNEEDKDQTMTLVVRGPSGSGTATLAETAKPTNAVTATAGATGATPPDAAVGAIRAAQGKELTVTMDPASGYYISQLTVTDREGNKLDYNWASMVEDENSDPAQWYPDWKADYDPAVGQQRFTLLMPPTGGRVEVTYAAKPIDPGSDPENPTFKKYTAQVVVNNSVYVGTKASKNNATLSNAVLGQLNEKLVTAEVGQWVDIDITVQAGYYIKPIFVSPQSFGIKPYLHLGNLDSQTTGFVMPAGDVTVYVEFGLDDQLTYNAMLEVKGFRGTVGSGNLGRNNATIESERTGLRGPIDSNRNPVSVEAAANREWVTVEYFWDPADSWVSSVTVRDQADQKDIPFTQGPTVVVTDQAGVTRNKSTITLPMVAEDIKITVTYKDSSEEPPPTPPGPDDPDPDPTPELTPVRLHVIDMTADGSINTEELGWGRVIHNGKPATDPPYNNGNIAPIPGDGTAPTRKPQDTQRVTALPIADGQTDAKWGNTKTIWVPAGGTVTLEAFSNKEEGVYIHSAYVLYRDGGQMINCNLKANNKFADTHEGHTDNSASGFYWCRSATFEAHPDYNDVYVYLTKKAPAEDEYAATLMLKSPDGDTGSAAAIWTWNTEENRYEDRATVKANGDHGRITAKYKEKVTVTVTPAEGYAVDYILVTPLGVPIVPQRVGSSNTYTFSMPGYNVNLCVYLKRSNERQFTATVHYIAAEETDGEAAANNKATITWSPDGVTSFSEYATFTRQDSSAMEVNENATVTLDVTLDQPFGVQAAYVLLKEGTLVPLTSALEGTVENASMTDNLLPDGTTTFIMPNGDVDVFVVFTEDPPPPDWHTVVLVATDTAPAGNNLGKNQGHLNLAGAADADRKTALSYGHMKPAEAGGGPAHVSITLPEYKADGTPNYFTVVAEPGDSYKFNPYKSGMTKNNPVYVQSITPVATFPLYSYLEPVGDCNRAVHLVFESTDDLKLTVEIEDPDNPGNDTVTNALTTTATGLPPLDLESVSALGSYQIMSGLTASAPVDLVVKPEEGYTAMAVLKVAGENTYVTLTPTNDDTGHLTGSFAMPSNDCVLTVTFFKPYEATLRLRDLSAGDHGAKMTESTLTPPDTVSVDKRTITEATLSDLPNGTKLTAQMIDFDKTNPREKVVGLLTRNGSTTILAPQPSAATDPDEYIHTINRAGATITLVVTDRDPADPNNDPYIAAVETVNKPSDTADPTIQATPAAADGASGAIWTAAKMGNDITVTFDVPAGYQAVVTSDHANGPTGTFSGPLTGKTATFPMPAANVQVTIEYRRVDFDLTLRVVDTTGVTNTTRVDPAVVMSGTKPLTADGDHAVVAAGTGVSVSATPAAGAVIRSITVSSTGRANNDLVSAPMAAGEAYTGSIPTMPDADTVVTVVYAKATPPSDDPDPYFLAFSAVDDPTNDSGNRVVSIQNITRSTLMGGGNLPVNSPYWTAGYARDSVTVSYETAPGYYATATATYKDNSGNDQNLVVVLLDHGTGGTATAAFPAPGADITITVHYSTVAPPKQTQDVALQLVGHKTEVSNYAQTTGGSLSGLSLNGAHTSRPPQFTGTTNPFDPVEEIRSAATVGDDLRTLASWANGYQVIRMTVAIRRDNGDGTVTETGEMDLLRSVYGNSVTSRTAMPTVGEDEIAVIRVYYGSNYTATLHIEPHGGNNQDVNGNQTSATTDGSAPINRHLDRLEDLAGGETIATTAKPGDGQRLVGVVYESPTKGATAADPPTDPDSHEYTFTMPEESVDFYAVYESADQNSHIAKVRFDDGDERLGDSRNAVTITNQSDPTAPKGKYWTAAKEGNAVVVNVKVAPGYKAKITTTHEDNKTCEEGGHYDFYINRTDFVPNLVLGKDATFTMPADTDATVFITFTKGYDLALEVVDVSHITGGLNQADVNIGSLHGESDGTNITYTPADAVETDSSGTKRVVTHGVEGGVTVTTGVTPASNDVPYKVYRRSLFTGTTRVDLPTGTPPTQPPSPYSYLMPSADVLETALFYNDETPLLAKVEVRGESDINGNSATPIIDYTDTVSATPKTTTGTVWTTTAEGNTIDLELTIAKGYKAKVKVRRDNTIDPTDPENEEVWEYLDVTTYQFQQEDPEKPGEFIPIVGSDEGEVQFRFRAGTGDFGTYISDVQHFRFIMPAGADATDVTVIVEFEFEGTMPQPFDPDNPAMDNIDLDRGFIYGENLGDFALIDIPTLYQDQELFNTDNYNKTNPADPQADVKFSFFLYNAGKDEYTPLVLGVDVLLEPEDEKTLLKPTDPYNYYRYETNLADDNDFLDGDDTRENTRPYTGSRFKLVPTEADELTGNRTDGAQALYDILNNNSSLARDENDALATNSEGKYYTTLYVMAEDAIGQKSAYTQVWIRPYFTIQVGVISYAPNHEMVASLYKLIEQDQDVMDLATGYKDEDGNIVPGATRVTVDTSLTAEQWAGDIEHYRWDDNVKPYLSAGVVYDGEDVLAAHKYYQRVELRSSELLGPYTKDYDPDPAKNLLNNVLKARADAGGFTYALTLEKTSCLTYTRVALDLWEGNGLSASSDPIPAGYDKDTLTYTVGDVISLITGDVDGNGYTKWQDYDTLYTYIYRNIRYDTTVTEAPDPTAPGYTPAQDTLWKISIYNPKSMAYRCDLNGDRTLTYQDLELVQTVFNYNRSKESYEWTKKSDNTKVLPFGFGKRDAGSYEFTLFALREMADVFPVDWDAYWDALVDPDTTEAPPLNNPYVDENGELCFPETLPEEVGGAPAKDRDPGGSRRDDAVMETPAGDEVMERPGGAIDLPAFDPGPAVELPTFDPDIPVDLPSFDPEDPAPDLPQNTDNGPGEDPAQQPPDDTKTEE